MGDWCTVESDPGIFTELLEQVGVRGVQVEELYALDDAAARERPGAPVYGLIFLFHWRADLASRAARPAMLAPPPELFFAKQVIHNACATQAVLSVVLNRPEIDLGEELRNFRAFTGDFSPDLKGLTISNSERLRAVHNSFARAGGLVLEEDSEKSAKPATKDDDVYHFISYVPLAGRLYELDGLRDGPVDLGPCDQDAWTPAAAPAILERVEMYARSEIRFSLLALVPNPEPALRAGIADARRDLDAGADPHAAALRLTELQAALDAHLAKRSAWSEENECRKHNYLPFILKLLEILARKDAQDPDTATKVLH